VRPLTPRPHPADYQNQNAVGVCASVIIVNECFAPVVGQVTAAEHPRVDYDSAESMSSDDEDDEDDEDFPSARRR